MLPAGCFFILRLQVGLSGTNRGVKHGGAELVKGRVIGDRYRLDAELGRGAMGVVWSAVSLLTAEEVALKIVVEPDPSLRGRLLREGRVCKGLRHPNVAEVYDVGETAAGQPFLVMQRLRGETLAEALARTPRLAEANAAAIALDIARALAAAHAVGVVHRDLKPANVFLHRAPGMAALVVKVLDFGVCKVQEPGDDLRTELGAPVGSLAYMAPEQAAGETDIDGRADIWSLGMVLFEMLAGRRLLVGSRMNLIRQLFYDPLPSLEEELRGTDAGLTAVVARCLAREREERWASAGDVADALSDACDRAEWSEGPRTRVSFSQGTSGGWPASPAAESPGVANAQSAFEPARPPLLALAYAPSGTAASVPARSRLDSWPEERAVMASAAVSPGLAAPPGRAAPPAVAVPSGLAVAPTERAPLPSAPDEDPRRPPPKGTVRMGSPALHAARDEALRGGGEARSAGVPGPGAGLAPGVAPAATPHAISGAHPAASVPLVAALPAQSALLSPPLAASAQLVSAQLAAPAPLAVPAPPPGPAPSGLAALPTWFAAASAVALVVVLGVVLLLMS